MRARAAIWGKQAVHGGDHRRLMRVARQAEGQVIEGTIKIGGGSRGGFAHPDQAEMPVIGHHRGWAKRVDVFGRQQVPRHDQFAQTPVQHGAEPFAGAKPVRLCKGFRQRHLIRLQRIRQSTRAQQRQVQRRLPQRRQGDDARRSRFDHAFQIHHLGKDDPRLDLRHAVDGGDFRQQTARRAGCTGEDIGKAVAFVKGIARLGQ